MRLGNHPLAIENFAASMDEGLLLDDPYGHDFIEASKRIVRNLASNELFQELPSLEEYEKILEKGNWSVERVKFTVMMCNRFEDHEMLRRCCMDAYTAQILGMSSHLCIRCIDDEEANLYYSQIPSFGCRI